MGKDPNRPSLDEGTPAAVPLARGMQALPEPGPWEPIEGTERDMSLKLSLHADVLDFDCSTNDIHFKKTWMFNTISHKFTVTIPSNKA